MFRYDKEKHEVIRDNERYPVLGEVKWVDEQDLELYKDFEVKEKCFGVTGDFCQIIAVPLQQPKEMKFQNLCDYKLNDEIGRISTLAYDRQRIGRSR